MALFGRDGDGHHSFGVLSALALNLSLLALPFAALSTWQALQRPDVYSYQVTPASTEKTRAALERANASLIADGADRRAAWSALIQREIDEGDFAAARGFLLSAPAMLPAGEASRLETQLPPQASDKLRAETALAFLDDAVRKQYEAGGSPLGAAAAPAPLSSPAAPDFFVLGDTHDLATQAAQWLRGDPMDVFVMALLGVGVASPAADPAAAAARIKLGASIVNAAKRAGKLTAPFSAQIEDRLLKAVPPQKLKQTLGAAFAAPKTADDAGVAAAFRSSIDPIEFKALSEELDDVTAMAKATSPSIAVLLLSHAENAGDLKRLRLIAESGGDRAAAAAKRVDGAALLKAAKGTLRMTQPVLLDFALLGLALAGVAISVLATLAQALLHEWRHGLAHAPQHGGHEAELRA